MRIVQLANFVGPMSGGQRVAITELGARYAAAGHDVLRIVPSERDGHRIESGVRIVEIGSRSLPGSGGYRIVTDTRRADRLVEAFAPDVVEVSDKTAFLRVARGARHRGARAVLFSHERIDAILADRVPAGVPLRRLADRWNRRVAASIDTIVCASDFAAQEFTRIGVTGVERVPLGVDLQRFSPAPVGADGPPIIVTVGRLSREKRTLTAVQAMSHVRHPGARLVIIGDGPERGTLEGFADRLPVEFVGHVSDRERLAALLRGASAALAPCPHETFGLGALECLATGVPLVVPDRGALQELTTPACGRVVDDDPASMARAVDELLASARGPLRQAARRRAEQFSWEASADAMLAIFERGRRAVLEPAC